MRRYLQSICRCRPGAGSGNYTRAMMIKKILTICAAVTAGAAGTSLALAQGYPPPAAPSTVYSTPLPPYPTRGYPADYGRGQGDSNFDTLFDGPDDDEAPQAQGSTALPPPGPVLSPDDPRYGRPYSGRPVYTD